MWILRELSSYQQRDILYTKPSYKLMKRVLPILLCLLALAVPRLYGQDRTVTFSAQPAEGGTVEASYLISWEEPPVTIGSGVR